MSKQTAIIFILVVFLGALGALIWFYFSFNSGSSIKPLPITTTDVYDPFGTRGGDSAAVGTTTETETNNTVINNTLTADKMRIISEEPISGFSIIENVKTKKTDIHYILRANGNIYETYTDSPELKRLSITTVLKVYESTWLPDGQKLIIRYLKGDTENIETFSVKINPATTTLNEFEGGIDGNHLPENISALAINPLGDKLFYLTENLNGVTGYISKPDGLNKKILFESPLVEWLVSWPKEEIITMNTKPSAKVAGYLYFLNSKIGSFSKVIGNINGLTSKTNSTATEVLYSDSTRNVSKLYLLNIKSGESKLLPWETFPEKCVWSNTNSKIIYCAVPKGFPTGEYPDVWYQGLASFTDDVWMIDTETMTSTLVFDIEAETNNKIDVTDIQIDKKDGFLFFTNKTDLTFWSLGLK